MEGLQDDRMKTNCQASRLRIQAYSTLKLPLWEKAEISTWFRARSRSIYLSRFQCLSNCQAECTTGRRDRGPGETAAREQDWHPAKRRCVIGVADGKCNTHRAWFELCRLPFVRSKPGARTRDGHHNIRRDMILSEPRRVLPNRRYASEGRRDRLRGSIRRARAPIMRG